MILALDYDGTYTLDPRFWNAFIQQAKSSGHSVICVTMRRKEEIAENMDCWVYYTERKAKKPHMLSLGIHVDIWIDDAPQFIIHDAWKPEN